MFTDGHSAVARIILGVESSDHLLHCRKAFIVKVACVKPKSASLNSSPTARWWSPKATYNKTNKSFLHGSSPNILVFQFFCLNICGRFSPFSSHKHLISISLSRSLL